MWKRIKIELEKINVKSLGFNHLIYFEVFNIKSESFTKIPKSFYDIFKKSFKKYKLDHNDMIMNICKEIIYNKKLKINLDEDLRDVKFEK